MLALEYVVDKFEMLATVLSYLHNIVDNITAILKNLVELKGDLEIALP